MDRVRSGLSNRNFVRKEEEEEPSSKVKRSPKIRQIFAGRRTAASHRETLIVSSRLGRRVTAIKLVRRP